jgi:hypothetical protein
MIPNAESVVYVPVYTADLPYVMDLISERILERQRAPRPQAVAAPSEESKLWGAGRLADLHGVTQPIQKAIITRIAESGAKGEHANYEQIRAAAEEVAKKKPLTYDHVRGNLAWISKYSRSITGTPMGPFELLDRGAEYDKGERYEYKMPREDAEAWLALVRQCRG